MLTLLLCHSFIGLHPSTPAHSANEQLSQDITSLHLLEASVVFVVTYLFCTVINRALHCQSTCAFRQVTGLAVFTESSGVLDGYDISYQEQNICFDVLHVVIPG